ncbi:hypothetical protein B5G52_12325 [Pseudoalteromonas sp. A601]|uniref:RNA polymerase sigma factor n=1 Tax=Pseudoalteromonas sp. A601 TaxID=1967839 RepID=UPI000B3D2679|nr:RNA polymerase sigma factor [Pseudoalteromonas sp. A601]OUS70985.1 hypothetical protein B5G52_12325 [Pseudoalteromonas sp. A601]
MSFNSNLSFQEIFDKSMMDRVKRFITHRNSNVSNTEDLVQETMVKALSRKKTTEIENINAYINQVAKSVICDNWERTKEQEALECNDLLVSNNENPELIAINQQKIIQLHSVLDSLPELRRKVFILRRVEGLSYDEISEQLEISQDAIKKHITRAMAQITLHVDRYN